MSENLFNDKDSIKSIIDNMYEAISLSHQFYLRLEDAELYDEINILRKQMLCCFRVLGSAANANELLKYESNPNVQLFDVTSLVRDITDNCRSKLRGVKVKLIFEDEETYLTECDPERFTACLMNLIVNALQNVDIEEGIIRISVKVRGEHISVTVSDNGYGLPLGKDIDLSSASAGNIGGYAVISKFCETYGASVILESGENNGFSASLRLPLKSIDGVDINACRARLDLGTFSPVNIYLSKLSNIDISDIY